MEGQKFIVLEVTYVMDTSEHSWGPIIRIYGRNKAGETVCANIRDFKPYMYFDYDPKFDVSTLENALSTVLTKDNARPPNGKYVYDCCMVERTCIMGYRPKGRSPYYMLTMTAPTQISTVRKYFEAHGIGTYEANVAYVLRLMIDCDFGGCHWISFDRVRECGTRKVKVTHNFEASYRDIRVDKDDQDLGAIRIMSFDLEACKFDKRGFVSAGEDPITQIGCSIETIDRTRVDDTVFCHARPGEGVTTPLPDPNINVVVSNSYEEVMTNFARYVSDNEVDILTGYNVDGFDYPYTFDWARTLGLSPDEFHNVLSRDSEMKSYAKKSFFQSAAKGTREDYQLSCQGRFSMDTLKFVKEFNKLRSYQLGSVAQHFTGETKVDMPYKLIPVYQRGTDDQRAHLAYYAWKDAKLCLELLDKRKAAIMYVQNARVCGVPWRFLVERGQQVLSHGLIARYCRPRHFIMPSGTEEENDEKTKGATVKDPQIGFYRDPIITLDFQSLYPSIIRARNICYSTLVTLPWARKNLKPDEYWIPPVPRCNYAFVTEKVNKGILSEIETTLFDFRNKAKGLKKQHNGTDLGIVYDKLQEAIKIRMNSLYGFTKANMLCAKELMEAICAEGRWMLDRTTEIVEANFPGSKVVYGDTDSVFVHFGAVSLEKAFDLGQKAAEMCTDFLTKIRTDQGLEPVHLLQREKGFQPFLLCGKKRYAGRKTLAPGLPFENSQSGMETVRRDNAKIASGTMEVCLENMIMQGDLDASKSIAYVHQVIRDLLMGRTPMSELIISKGLSKSKQHYEESSTKQVHSELAKRIEARSEHTGEEPYHTGDRVKFVMVKGYKKAPAFERSEDPLFALKHRIPVDYDYYIENQMMKPLLRIFTPILAPDEKLKKINSKGNKVPLNQKEIESLTAYKVLFTGPHMRQMVQKIPEATDGSIVGFFKRRRRCLTCSCDHGGVGALCSYCQGGAEAKKQELQEQMDSFTQVKGACLTTCRKCVSDETLQEFPPCSNNDCDNFYRREKVLVDMEDLGDKLKLFG